MIRPLKVLVACEFSGTVRDAFNRLGHFATSCDILPTESPGEHYLGDVREILHRHWDLIIAHPPCTYLNCASAWALKDPDFDRFPGVGYHQKVKPETLTGAERRRARQEAGQFALDIWNAGENVVIENPRGGLNEFIRDGAKQEVQPHQYGDDASKATCLRFKGVRRLVPTDHIAPRMVGGKPRWANQTDNGQNRLVPSDDRWKERSKTYQGIANAMAGQYGGVVTHPLI